MKKVLFPILALVLALGLALPAAMPAVADPDPGIVGLWHLDGNANDSSGNGNDGTVIGASFVSGKFDEGLSFDGINDYVQVDDDDTLSTGTALTVEAWVKPAATPSGLEMVVGKWNDGYREYEVMLFDGKVRFYAYSSVPGITYAESSTTLSVDMWYHVAGVYNGSNLQVYINGSPDGSPTAFTASIPNTDAKLTIGAQYWGDVWGRHFTGLIDEVRIWDVALTAEQIEGSFNLSKLEFTKELVSADPALTPDTNGNGIPEVPIATNITFTMNITIDNSATGLNLTAVMVKDRLGAELKIVSLNETAGAANYYTTSDGKPKNRSGKVFITWNIGSLYDGDAGTLTIVAYTDINPGKGRGKVHQEYTSEGVYELNSGATLTFCVEIAGEEICLVMTTDGLWVEVLEEELEDD